MLKKQKGNDLLMEKETLLWEVFVRSKNGLSHKHVGSIHASDKMMALNSARDTYTRRNEGISIWVVPSHLITASTPGDISEALENSGNKIYRHPSFYDIPDDVGHM